MIERVTTIVLRWARVQPEPKPPIGALGSVRTFRAGRNYYYVRLLRWGATQIGAAIGIVFSVGFTAALLEGISRIAPRAPYASASPSPAPSASRSPSARPTPNPGTSPEAGGASQRGAAEVASSPGGPRRTRIRLSGEEASREVASRIAARIPPQGMSFVRNWVVPFLLLLEFFAISTFLLSLPFTYGLAKLEFEQHWYIVTDRSLRIRTGVLSLSESTMSFANLQQVEVKQGPLQRFLGLADVRVRSAGGGDHGEDEGVPLHTGIFHSVENAEEIRDLILARLKAFREAGLGDPDRARAAEISTEQATGVSADTLDAAREVLRQTRTLRTAQEAPVRREPRDTRSPGG